MSTRKSRPSFANLKRDLNLHNLFRQTPSNKDVNKPTSAVVPTAQASTVTHLRPVGTGQPRRESFLYRAAIDDEREHNLPCGSVSRASSLTSAIHE